MRHAAVLGTVTLTELAAHFLSLGWGIMILLAAFAWVALSGTTVAAKARSTEDRVNALIPVVGTAFTAAASAQATANNAFPRTGGTISGSVTVNGSHTVNGQINSSALSVSGASTDYGHTTHGSLSVDDSVSVGGNHTVGGQVNSNTLSVSGPATTYGLTVHGGVSVDSSISASNFSGSYAGGQSGVTTSNGTLASTASAVNGCIARMESAGLI